MYELPLIIRGGAWRFVAGVLTGLTVWYGLDALITKMSIGSTDALGVFNLVLCLTAGYVVSLPLLRPTSHSADDIEGGRSYLAGLGSIVAFVAVDLILEILHPGQGVIYGRHASRIAMEATAFAAGGATTLALFFRRIADRKRDVAELADALDAIRASRP